MPITGFGRGSMARCSLWNSDASQPHLRHVSADAGDGAPEFLCGPRANPRVGGHPLPLGDGRPGHYRALRQDAHAPASARGGADGDSSGGAASGDARPVGGCPAAVAGLGCARSGVMVKGRV
jgi:hypothetical protein